MSPEELVPEEFEPQVKSQPTEAMAPIRRHKMIIDADAGIVDALTIMVAILDPQVDVLALTATAGVVSGKQANQNLQTILNRMDPQKYPRIGCTEEELPALISSLREVPIPLLIGENGLGDCPTTAVSLASPHASAKVLVDVVRSNPHEVTVLTLGPMTNIVLACEIYPDFLQDVKSLICLGGSITDGGDVTATSEGNVYADPEAARYVFKSKCLKTLVPLDISDQLRLNFGALDRLPQDSQSHISELVHQLLSFALRSSRRHLGQEGIALNGLAALAAAVRPQFFSRRLMSVDVETGGELTRGMLVVDRRGVRHEEANLEVLTEIDDHAAFDYFTGVLWSAIENGE